jgi:hypothetical protein
VVGKAPEDPGAESSHRQRQGDRKSDGGDGGGKLVRNIAQNEDHDEEIERIEGPAKIGRGDNVAFGLAILLHAGALRVDSE